MSQLTSESSLRTAAEAYRRVLFKGEGHDIIPSYVEAGFHILLELMLKIDSDSRHALEVLIQNPWFDDFVARLDLLFPSSGSSALTFLRHKFIIFFC